MPSYRKRSNGYLAYFRYQSRQYSRVVPTKAEGEKWHRAKLRELEREQTEKPRSCAMMYSRAVDEYLRDCSPRMRLNTVREKLSHYKRFGDYLLDVLRLGKEVMIEDITPAMCRKYVVQAVQVRAEKTVNREIRNLKALWNWLVKAEHIHANVWGNVPLLPEDEVQRPVPTAEDLKAVFDQASPWEQDFLSMLVATGARSGEICRLTWADVDFKRYKIKVWTRKRKGGRKEFRLLPMDTNMRDVLNRQSQGTELGTGK